MRCYLISATAHQHCLNLTDPRPLPGAPGNHTGPTTTRPVIRRPSPALLLLVKDQLQHIVRELRELETHGLELWLCIVAQTVAPRSPESGDGLADGLVPGVGLLVYEAGVGKLAFGGGCGAVDLRVGEGLELGQAEALGKGVDAGMNEEASTVVVGNGLAGVLLERSVAGGRRLLGEVFACVEVFDNGAHGVHIAISEGDLARLSVFSMCAPVSRQDSMRTPPGAKLSTCLANSGDLRMTASWAEYVVLDSPLPTRTSTMGLFIKLVQSIMMLRYVLNQTATTVRRQARVEMRD